MRPVQDDGILAFRPSWAPSTPIDVKAEPPSASITFTADEFEAIEDVYRQLRPMEESRPKTWLAYVDELKGSENDLGLREGEVLFTIFDDDQVIRARASLTTEQYQVAYKFHNPARPLAVKGQLHRGPRMSRLTQITELSPALSSDVNG
jgi:hypothetical protein